MARTSVSVRRRVAALLLRDGLCLRGLVIAYSFASSKVLVVMVVCSNARLLWTFDD